MDVQMLEQWIKKLSPFEQKLKEWYQKHGVLMPESVFVQKHMELQKLNQKEANLFSRLDAGCKDYRQIDKCTGGHYANLSRVQWKEEKEQFFIQKHPNYFPEMKVKMDKVGISYMMYGRGEIILDVGEKTERIVLQEGDLFLVALDNVVARSVTDDESVMVVAGMGEEAFYKSLTESYSQGILAGFFAGILCQKKNSSYLIFHTESDGWIRHLFQHAMLEFAEGGAASYQIVPLVMELIFAYVQKDYGEKTTLSVKGNMSVSRIPLFLRYLQVNYQKFSLEEMAQHFHLSSFYISRSFRKYMGKTIRETVKEIRISVAEILLQNTEYGVNEIAELVGYQDISYFIELFRKEKGLTPLQYRKSMEN